MYNDVMERTTIMADDETIERLRLIATERGVSFATVVREALQEKAREYNPRPRSLGAGESRPGATGRVHASRRQPPRAWR
jgi:predicted transcriptional regulator